MKYRKRPVVIEAERLTLINGADLAKWCGGRWIEFARPDTSCVEICTLEGTMTACIGDWIIKGVKGEFYPCRPDIFAATYEPVE